MTRVFLFDIKKSQKNNRLEKVRQPSLRDMYENMYIYMNIYMYTFKERDTDGNGESNRQREIWCERETEKIDRETRVVFWTHNSTTGQF